VTALRIELGLTGEALAHYLGIARSTLTHWETGRYSAWHCKIFEALAVIEEHCMVDELLEKVRQAAEAEEQPIEPETAPAEDAANAARLMDTESLIRILLARLENERSNERLGAK